MAVQMGLAIFIFLFSFFWGGGEKVAVDYKYKLGKIKTWFSSWKLCALSLGSLQDRDDIGLQGCFKRSTTKIENVS